MSLLERKDAVDEDEENDAEREDVDLPPVVHKLLPYLWSHVSLCAFVRLQFFYSLVCCKSEVDNLKIHLVINKDVFKLEVAMNNPFLVHITDRI